jgi:hypothetical protein
MDAAAHHEGCSEDRPMGAAPGPLHAPGTRAGLWGHGRETPSGSNICGPVRRGPLSVVVGQ